MLTKKVLIFPIILVRCVRRHGRSSVLDAAVQSAFPTVRSETDAMLRVNNRLVNDLDINLVPIRASMSFTVEDVLFFVASENNF